MTNHLSQPRGFSINVQFSDPRVTIPSISWIGLRPRPALRKNHPVLHTERSTKACRSEQSLPTLLQFPDRQFRSSNVLKKPRQSTTFTTATCPHPFLYPHIYPMHLHSHPPMPGVRGEIFRVHVFRRRTLRAVV